jgi:hypothetical protein
MRRTFLRLTGVVSVAVLLAACAASGAKFQEVASAMPSLKPGEGRIYFFRSSSIVGAAIQPEIRLNGQVVGTSRPGGFFYVDRPAGNHAATAATETEKSATFVLQPGETKYLRTTTSVGVFVGRIVVELESPDKAKAELPSLSYTGAEKISAK